MEVRGSFSKTVIRMDDVTMVFRKIAPGVYLTVNSKELRIRERRITRCQVRHPACDESLGAQIIPGIMPEVKG